MADSAALSWDTVVWVELAWVAWFIAASLGTAGVDAFAWCSSLLAFAAALLAPLVRGMVLAVTGVGHYWCS